MVSYDVIPLNSTSSSSTSFLNGINWTYEIAAAIIGFVVGTIVFLIAICCEKRKNKGSNDDNSDEDDEEEGEEDEEEEDDDKSNDFDTV